MKFFDRFPSLQKLLKYFLSAVLVLLFASLLYTCRNYYTSVQKYRYDTVNKYKREVNDLINQIDNIGDNLYKAYLCKDYGQTAKTVFGIYSDAAFAACSLNNLPSEDGILQNCVMFLNQVGDYSASCALKALDDKPLSMEERNNFLNFARYSENLLNSLVKLSDDINVGRTDLGVFADGKYKENPLKDTFASIKESFSDYETPKYDGKYSGSLKKPADYTGYPEITAEEAVGIVNKKMGLEVKDYDLSESQSDTAGRLYNITFKNNAGNNIYAAVTAKAGLLLGYNSQRIPEGTNYALNDALDVCRQFVSDNGFPNFEVFEFNIYENIAEVFLAYKENGIIFYPATIEMKIALDNLEILFVDYMGYLNMLNFNSPLTFNYSPDEVRGKLSEYNVSRINKAVISDDFKYNYSAYEAEISVNDKKFLVYLSGENLKQEGISMVTEDNMTRFVR